MPARHVNRTMALMALGTAADASGVMPDELSAAAYRQFRSQHRDMGVLPTDVTISLLFGGWHRACEHARDVRRSPEEVEEDVRDTLYGAPSNVERVAIEP